MTKFIKGITGAEDLKQRFPRTYDYFTAKNPTSIVIMPAYVLLTNSKTGVSLAYDIFDIENFEKILQ